MPLTGLDLLLWALSLIGHCILLAVLLFRRRARTFRVFTTLVAVNVIKTIVLYFTLHFASSEDYFHTYWTLAVIDTLLQIALAYEIASRVFQPLGAWAPDVRRSFLSIVVTSIVIATGLTWLASPPTRTLRLALVIRGNFLSSALLSELLIAMMALSVTLGLPWRTHAARLAQGLGIYSTFGIITDAAHNYFGSDRGKQTYRLLSHVEMVLYLLCLTYWIITLAQNEPKPRELPKQLHEELRALQRKTALLLRNLRAVGSTS